MTNSRNERCSTREAIKSAKDCISKAPYRLCHLYVYTHIYFLYAHSDEQIQLSRGGFAATNRFEWVADRQVELKDAGDEVIDGISRNVASVARQRYVGIFRNSTVAISYAVLGIVRCSVNRCEIAWFSFILIFRSWIRFLRNGDWSNARFNFILRNSQVKR